MPTKKSVGARIREAREAKGWSQEELGQRYGVSHAAISDLERGVTQKIDIDDLERLARLLDRPLNYFLGRETDADRIQAELRRASEALEQTRKRLQDLVPYSGQWVWLPLIGTVPALYPEWLDLQEAKEFYPCSVQQIKKPDGDYAVRVKGDLMIGHRILDGDIIFVDVGRQPELGDVVVARKDEEVLLRTYKEDAKGLYLTAGNEGYPILRLEDARILGVVVGLYREKP